MTELVRRPLYPPTRDAVEQRAAVNMITRTATALVLAAERSDHPRQDPVEVAEKMFQGDKNVRWLTRSAVSPTTTGNTPALLTTLTEYLIASLSGISAAAMLLPRTLQLSFDGSAMISVPGFVSDASGASFVGEGAVIPARSLVATSLSLDPSKLASISAFTEEMIASSGNNAQAMIEDTMKRSLGLALDASLFDANPAVTDVRPAGLRNGVGASTASVVTNPLDAMVADIKTLTGIVAPISGTEPIVLVAAPARAKTMPLRSIALAMDSSFVILPSAAIAANDLLCIAPGAVASATGSIPQISVSRETLLHMSDTPSDIGVVGTPPTVASPAKSFFQSDLIALKCRLEVSWGKRHPASVAWITGITAW